MLKAITPRNVLSTLAYSVEICKQGRCAEIFKLPVYARECAVAEQTEKQLSVYYFFW